MAMKSPSGEILMKQTLVVMVVGPIVSKDIAEKQILDHLLLQVRSSTYAYHLYTHREFAYR